MQVLFNTILAILTLLYPAAVYFGIHHFEPWKIALALMVLLLLRLAINQATKQWSKPLLIVSLAYGAVAIWHNDLITLRFYPVLVNAVMLVIFAWSLWFPPSMIERLARLQQPDLPAAGMVYTYRVTQVWCLFFIFNGSIALLTAVWGSFECWSLYNGFIAYLLMGLLFAGEYAVRIKTQKQID